uniref:Replication factor A C-terminal domain-containing protein n=1 Tax=Ananas comosus var. bracteatus TaxID=296719 RepID=A0A6V7Q5L1_ANACO|nr:unnamed protein product [Ananas comosus var. bracteatus]
MNRIGKDYDAIQRITYGEQKPIPPQEEMCENRKSIAELLNLNFDDAENVKFTCEAKIIEIDTSYGWWYKACHNCKAAVKIYDDTFWYKLSTIVEDRSGITNFTIFGKLAQDLIRIPAQNLAVAVNSDRFVLPPIVKTIIDQTHIFQIVIDSQSFRSGTPSFKVLKFLP